jgi:hypothetical protein
MTSFAFLMECIGTAARNAKGGQSIQEVVLALALIERQRCTGRFLALCGRECQTNP